MRRYSKTKIAFDIDDVIFPTTIPIFRRLRQEFPNSIIDESKIDHWDIAECLGLPRKDVEYLIYDTIRTTYFPLNFGCGETLNFFDEFFEYHFITARNVLLADHTIQNLKMVFEDLSDRVHFTHDKSSVVKEFGIELFIDDRAKTITEIHTNTECIPIVYDKPWNRKLLQRFKRVTNWYDIHETLYKFKGGIL